MNKLICAVVVAYNNPDELKELIEGLKGQCIDNIDLIVIDNSDYGNAVKNQEIIKKNEVKGKTYYYLMKENIGSAQAFSLAMKIAFEKGYEYIWLNDQDGIPNYDCLKLLLDMSEKYDNNALIAPKIIGKETGRRVGNFRCKKNIFLNGFETEQCEIDYGGTAGILITKKVIEKVGIYDGKNFFVGYEDKEYCLRAKKKGVPIFQCESAIYWHPDLSMKYGYNNRGMIRKSLKYLLPQYLGACKEGNKRQEYICRGCAYINENYCNIILAKLNVIYSIFRACFEKLIGKNISIKDTLNRYRDGSKNVNNCSSPNENVFYSLIKNYLEI